MKATSLIFFAFLSLFVSSPALLAAGSSPPEKKKETAAEMVEFKKGYNLLKKKRYAEAQVFFEKAIALKSDFPEAHNNLAYVLRKQSPDNFAISEKHYNIALKQNPKLAQAYAYRGALYTLQGYKEKAEKDYKSLLALDKKLASELRAVIDAGNDENAKKGFGVYSTAGGY